MTPPSPPSVRARSVPVAQSERGEVRSFDRKGGKGEISVIDDLLRLRDVRLGLEVEVESGLEAVELELAGGEEVLDHGRHGGLPEGRLVGQLPHGGPGQGLRLGHGLGVGAEAGLVTGEVTGELSGVVGPVFVLGLG